VPALLLTAIAAFWTSFNVEPDYQVTGHIAVVGPAVQRAEGDAALTPVNPWSAEALADAATIRLQGKPLADTLAAEGYSGGWSAFVTGRLPVIRLEVIAPRPEQAQATMERLREVVDEEVRTRQEEYNVAAEEQISTVPYDGGETVEPVTGKVKRALIVVVGAGLVMTTGAVVAFDAIARRRRAVAEGTPPAPVSEPPAVPGSASAPEIAWPEPAAGGRARYRYATAETAAAVSGAPGTGPANGHAGPGSGPTAGARASSHPVRVHYAEQPISSPVSPAAPVSPPATVEPLHVGEIHLDDSTVVLPLSNAGFVRKPKDDHGFPEA
jgi:capsular polysaccharide biosynthesis protein